MDKNTPAEKGRPHLRRHAFKGRGIQARISDWSAKSELAYEGRGGEPERQSGEARDD
jgi:hypothetical protein